MCFLLLLCWMLFNFTVLKVLVPLIHKGGWVKEGGRVIDDREIWDL